MCEEYNDDIDGITYLKNLFNFYEQEENRIDQVADNHN